MKRTKMENTNNHANNIRNENKFEIDDLDGVSVHELMNKLNGGLTYNGNKFLLQF